MGRIIASVTIANLGDPAAHLRCDAMVDTGASHMVLPAAWRDRLGDLEQVATVALETATQDTVQGTICGPVRIEIEGFRPIFNEVLFLDMAPANGEYEPLIGYVILEQSQAAVDMLGHRLIPVTRMDLKSVPVVAWHQTCTSTCRVITVSGSPFSARTSRHSLIASCTFISASSTVLP